MKHSKLMIVSVILVVTLCFCSCEEMENAKRIPETSENFSQEFVDSFVSEYRLYDPQLHYLTAEPYGVRLDASPQNMPQSSGYSWLLVSPIHNVSKEQFVAVTCYGFRSNVIGVMPKVRVYQKKDAPVPMKDYTVSSVSVVRTSAYPSNFYSSAIFEDFEKEVLNYMEVFLESKYTEILAEFQLEEDQELIHSLRQSYHHTIPYNLYFNWVCTGEDERRLDVGYYLLFRFEETENLVWYVPIYEDDTPERNLYYKYVYYDVTTKTQTDGTEFFSYKENKVFAPISEDVAEILRDLMGI